jgi:hydroxymethylbilane synthase
VIKRRKISIATRRSPLALWQANTVKRLLEEKNFDVDLNLVTTSGDKMQKGALANVALDDPNLPAHLRTGKGLFVKEVQEEILAERADLAVHSMKDLPVESTQGLRVVAVLPRANPADVMIFSPQLLARMVPYIRTNDSLDRQHETVIHALRMLNWPDLAEIGTTSSRRQHFLKRLFAPAEIPLVVLRGNVDSRLTKAANNDYSFIMLARAGLDRLGLFNAQTMMTLPIDVSTPAPAQGVVAIECRESDEQLRECLKTLNDPLTSLAAACERAALWLTGGNCHTALAAFFDGRQLKTWAAKEQLFSELTFLFTADESGQLQRWSRSVDQCQLFESLIRSPIAERLHQQLLNQGFQTMMSLRSPVTHY